jgi:hypothetical protein|tara:strand:- start:2673 stop:3002 length:330 start_codon:yes stop_codon:yes gene_type:complete
MTRIYKIESLGEFGIWFSERRAWFDGKDWYVGKLFRTGDRIVVADVFFKGQETSMQGIGLTKKSAFKDARKLIKLHGTTTATCINVSTAIKGGSIKGGFPKSHRKAFGD